MCQNRGHICTDMRSPEDMRRIAPKNNNGSIKLEFSYQGSRYALSPGGKFSDPLALAKAHEISNRIYVDCLSGNFDSTLVKYKPEKPTTEEKPPTNVKPTLLLDAWDKWVSTLQLSPRTLNNHYSLIRKMIQGSKPVPTVIDTEWLLQYEGLAPRTFNDRLTYLRSLGGWMTEEGITSKNPYSKLKARKIIKSEVKPFSEDEMRAIVEAFQSDRFCSKFSAVRHSHYADYVRFLFMTGCRPSEAIGLRWRDVDLSKGIITISSVLARDEDGRTSSNRRVRKETKTNSIRTLSCKGALKEMLLSRKSNDATPDELVFGSPEGLPIDDKNFRNRQWKTVLEGLKIEYRKPYTTRHTLLSHAIEKGMALTQVAYIAGHTNTRMVSTTYGHLINKPELPDLGL